MAELLTLTHGVIHGGNLISHLQFEFRLIINHFFLHRFCSALNVAVGVGPGLWAELGPELHRVGHSLSPTEL